MDTFIFNVTKMCDKKCEICCNGSHLAKNINMSFYKFRDKIKQISDYGSKNSRSLVIGLVGGEPFLYNFTDTESKRYELANLVEYIFNSMDSSVVIKTSGWVETQKYFNRQFYSIKNATYGNNIEIRLGLNLYQSSYALAEIRLKNMLKITKESQDFLCIDTIYDKSNIEETISLFEHWTSENDLKSDNPISCIRNRPNIVSQFKYYSKNFLVKINTSPAYNPISKTNSNIYWDVITDNICPYQKNKFNHIMYDHNLSIYHCNDPYGNYSLPGVSTELFGGIEEESEYIKNKLSDICALVKDNKISFKNKRDRCLFCSDYFLSRGTVRNVL